MVAECSRAFSPRPGGHNISGPLEYVTPAPCRSTISPLFISSSTSLASLPLASRSGSWVQPGRSLRRYSHSSFPYGRRNQDGGGLEAILFAPSMSASEPSSHKSVSPFSPLAERWRTSVMRTSIVTRGLTPCPLANSRQNICRNICYAVGIPVSSCPLPNS
ncbi:hypothetical protein BV25DRAFT_414919 [Artomyces pyxidatus]|uniref:Uncharacterized protein n=1 Tax=Artomyces pyxidatus TaxID=48021 RepID=A0ACB8T5A1_9AGAM|nr:hypothetical protein BV25DRAFT_414919 [Artomyces pyxidatus]